MPGAPRYMSEQLVLGDRWILLSGMPAERTVRVRQSEQERPARQQLFGSRTDVPGELVHGNGGLPVHEPALSRLLAIADTHGQQHPTDLRSR
jgi:hypothetical protein